MMSALTQWLTFTGALPFIGALALNVLGWNFETLNPFWLFHTYSVIILTFIAGSLWGQASHFKSSKHQYLLLISNIWALLAWLGLVLTIYLGWVAILINLIGYAHIFWSEQRFLVAQAPINYYRLRRQISVIVIALHFLMIISLVLTN